MLLLRVLVLCGGLFIAVQTASATPIVGGFDDLSAGDIVHVEKFPIGFRVTKTVSGSLIADFITFCVERTAPIETGDYRVNFGTDIEPETAYIYDRYRLGGFASAFFPYPPGPPGGPFDPPLSIQLSIDYFEGVGAAPNAITNCALGIDTPAAGLTGCVHWIGLGTVRALVLTSVNPTFPSNVQDLLVRLPPGGGGNEQTTPIPEPATLVLVGLGLGFVSRLSRRRKG